MSAVRQDEDVKLLTEALHALELSGCQFWACEGPTLEPIAMITCHACAAMARLRQRLGQPVDR